MGGFMTQKELSYVEDAVGHEKSIIKICEDMIKNLSDDNFISYMQNEITTHQNMENELMTLLKEKANG